MNRYLNVKLAKFLLNNLLLESFNQKESMTTKWFFLLDL